MYSVRKRRIDKNENTYFSLDSILPLSIHLNSTGEYYCDTSLLMNEFGAESWNKPGCFLLVIKMPDVDRLGAWK